MEQNRDLLVRAACPSDAEAVGAVLRATYPALLQAAYDASLLERALPLLVEANAALLGCGTWYVAESPGGPRPLVGCGGWTLAPPGARISEPDRTVGQLRHFATHPCCGRRGVGRAIMARCLADALAAGVAVFECQSTLNAEGFYRALGFEPVQPITVMLGGRIPFPGLLLRLHLSKRPLDGGGTSGMACAHAPFPPEAERWAWT